MEFRRINGLPPYVFAEIDALKLAARRAGDDVIDLGFGNPDIPSPDVAVEKLVEAAHNPRNHRYSSSRGIPKLRQAIADLYLRRFGVELDPDREVVTTIGAKEGLSHLMWVLVGPGDTALVPSPSYPIHIYAPLFAGADVRMVRLEDLGSDESDAGEAFFANLVEAWESAWPKPKVVIFSFPHNPTTACIDLADDDAARRVRQGARRLVGPRLRLLRDRLRRLPAALDPRGARRQGRRRRALHADQVVLDGRLAGRVPRRQRRGRAGAHEAEELSRLRHVPADPDRRDRGDERGAASIPKVVNEIYQHRRDALCDGLDRIGWEVTRPKGTMFVWAPIPEPYKEMGSLEFSKFLVAEAKVATSPGVGFGPGGDGFVRFALIENEQRIAQGMRTLKAALPKL